MRHSLEDLNRMDQATFTKTLGWVFEHSPWIAEKAWNDRPFTSLNALHQALTKVVEEAPMTEKLNLLRAHPELASREKMAEASVQEQAGAGLDQQLSQEEYEDFIALNQAYSQRFGFPFIMAVRGQTRSSIRAALWKRLGEEPEAELKRALEEVYKIARFRLEDIFGNTENTKADKPLQVRRDTMETHQSQKRVMFYGKGDVFVYRTYAKPLIGVKQIPESSFTKKDNVIFGMNVKIALHGDKFLSSFTEGDNSLVIATDSMKNFIQRQAAHYEGSTIEGFLEFICKRFLEKYSHVTSIDISADEIPFDPCLVPGEFGLQGSGLVYRHSRNEHATVSMEVARSAKGCDIIRHQSSITDLHLIKVSGSSFYGYIQDEYTTLPEAYDRPLFIYVNIGWRYDNVADASGVDPSRYVPAEQVRDIARTVFHQLNNRSIQHLIYHIGRRILQRFPQLAEVQFETNNRTWTTVVEDIPNSQGGVFTEPMPPYGFQGFTMTQADIEKTQTDKEPVLAGAEAE